MFGLEKTNDGARGEKIFIFWSFMNESSVIESSAVTCRINTKTYETSASDEVNTEFSLVVFKYLFFYV